MNEKEIRKALGHRIRVRRAEKNMPQEDLAQRISMGQSQLSRVERGQLGLEVMQLLAIAEALECSAGYLLGEEAKK